MKPSDSEDSAEKTPSGKRSLRGVPGKNRERFIKKIRVVAEQVGFRLVEYPEMNPAQLRIEFSSLFPMWMRIEMEEDAAVMVGVVRTEGFPGDRSDYHDLISLIWAATLRALDMASVRLIDIPHPAVAGEIYGRYLLMDRQPNASFISLEKPDYGLLKQVLVGSRLAATIFSLVYQASGGDPAIEDCQGTEGGAWKSAVGRALSYKPNVHYELWNHRRRPSWLYYRRNDRGVVAVAFRTNLLELLPPDLARAKVKLVEGIGCWLVDSGEIKNAVQKSALKRLCRLLHAYGLRVDPQLARLVDGDLTAILPVESDIICVTKGGIAAIKSESGYRQFWDGHAALLRRHQAEARILHSSINFKWRKHLDDDRFENLILDLLNRDPAVSWARKVGVSSAADAGRDIIADWLLGPAAWESARIERATTWRKVVVQCKAYNVPINLSKMPDVPQVLDFHNADGYLLVALPRITPQVVDYMTTVPTRRRFWASWWTKPEIEDRLRANLDIARRYRDLLIVGS